MIEPNHRRDPDQFLITALGASAGGLEALEKFFENMPVDAGMAFIVVMHLSPDHSSALPELLARCTQMAVEQAKDQTKIAPNRVYIIPPNATLTVKNRTLRVTDRAEPRGRRTAIDSLFRSLAEDCGECAVCIILSGTGTDGTVGLRAVKEHGGMAMAQTLGSAKYDAILRSAISTGLVDHVLPVAEMPVKLTEYAAHLSLLNGQSSSIRQQLEKHSTRLHTLLRRKVGHDFSQYKDGTIVRRLERRMKALQIETVEQYVHILDSQPEEADLLFKDLLIGVTGFFRDPEAFEALGREVIPRLFTRTEAGKQLRVCVVGCATGEEAYSIAILLAEHASTLDDPPEIKVFATDIDDRGLETARKGQYPESIAEHVNPERLSRFFIKQDGTYQVKRELREMCLFSSHSFIKDPPFSRLDLISCRNVMIYLGDNLQRKVVPLFQYALRPGGFLFLGPSETVSAFRELFRPVDKKRRIFQRKDALARTPVTFPLTDVSRATYVPGANFEQERNVPKRLERIILKRYAPASVIVSESGDAVYYSGGISRYLEQPTGTPDNNVLNIAQEGLRIPLRTGLHKVVTARGRFVQKHVSIQMNGATTYVDVTIEALSEPQEANLYIIIIADALPEIGQQAAPSSVYDSSSAELISHLEGELRASQEHAQTIFEELESSNEELRSANEEYQSTNEELETSKEELQSFNEELETVNSELNRKVGELDAANSDLQNVLNSTQIAIIFLDADLNIRSFTPTAASMFRLLGGDIGRPITDLSTGFTGADLVTDARQVLATLSPIENPVAGAGGEHYQRRITPYRTVHNVIAGVVVTFIDVTQLRLAEQRAQQERAFARSIVDTVREPLIVMDRNLRVITGSKAFYETFRVSPEETIGRSFLDLGNRQWDLPELRELLADMLPKNERVDDFEVAHEFPALGYRAMLLNASRLEQGSDGDPLILLAIEDITERKRATEALRSSERRLREIIEAIPATVYTTDSQGRVTMFNQAAVEFSGRTPELGTDEWCVTWKVHGLDGGVLPFHRSPMATAIKEDRPIRGTEAIAERPDGTRRNFLAYPTPLHDDSGNLTGAVNMLVDITGLRNVEQALREREKSMRSLFEQTSAGIVQTDLTGRLTIVNDRFCQIVGRSREDLLTLTMQDITHPEDLAASVSLFAALAEGRGPNFEIEKRYVCRDGSLVWVQDQVSAIHDDQGNIRAVAATVTNISERKRAEELQARLVALVDSSDDAIISTDLQAVIRSWNAGAERLFGYTSEEAVGKPVTILIPPDLVEKEMGIFKRICRGERVEHFDTLRRRKDGVLIDISLTLSAIFNERGQVTGVSRIARDISDQKRIEQERLVMEERERAMALSTALRDAEAELARVSRALTVGELATSIAHEVNQPLAGIVTNAEACLRWIKAQTPNLHEAQESLALIVRDGNRASEVIHRIREFLKKESPRPTSLNINDVANETVALVADELQKRSVDLRCDFGEDLPSVRGDRIQLQQVILNLIINGSEAMESNAHGTRHLLMTSRLSGTDHILFSVRDSGSGIDTAHKDRMFDAFFTTKPAGIGMGLSISRTIIEAHGGRIWATPNDGIGLTVQFTLPVEGDSP